MKHEDALTICGIISDVITSRRGASLFPHGKEGEPSNLGSIWVDQIERIPEDEAELATRAAVELMTGMVEIPTPTDFHSIFRKMKKDRRMATPALPEPEFKREVSDWMKGKILALYRNDFRVWSEQKPGYDTLQTTNPSFRTYVWGEQEQMPEEERERYIEQASRMDSKAFDAVYLAVVGGGAR